MIVKEWVQLPQAQSGTKPGVVAQAGVSIEREVRAIDGEAILDQAADHLVAFPRPRVGGSPENAVMHQQQVRLACHGQPDGRQGRIHRRRDPGNRPTVLDLQPIGSLVVILHLGRVQQPVAVRDKRRQRNL